MLNVGLPGIAFGAGLVAALTWSNPVARVEQRSAAIERWDDVRYGRDVRPILSDRCFQCHGADEAAREADLRLDLREVATSGKTPAIVPGDHRASELWRRVTNTDPDEVMPPPPAKKRPLSAEELDVLAAWIDAGAEYEPHWAFVPPSRPDVPDVENVAWPRGSLDRFVLAGLDAREVAPSPPADAATLLRRVFLDLTGLPPTEQELAEYLADRDPNAFERVVDRLLTTEPYRSRLAEHLAAPWLDAARYSDTIGTHTDNGRQIWLWRDWVLTAFRDNMPYDRFVTEQLAGDLLPDATVAQQIASGFNRNHVATDEGGAIAEEYLVEYAIDRVSTTSTVFLGLTMGCARCHDHKYDPITQADFYGLVGFFNSVDEPGLFSQTSNANRAYEPFLEVPSPEQRADLDRLSGRHEALVQELAEPLPGEAESFDAFLRDVVTSAGVAWSTPAVLAAESSDPRVALESQDDGSILATGPMPDFEDYTLSLRSTASTQRLLLIEAMTTPNPDASSATPDGAGRASHGNAVVSHLRLEARPAVDDAQEFREFPLSWAWADHTQRNRDFEAGNMLDPDARGWAADGNASAGPRTLLILAEQPFGNPDGTDLRITLSFRSQYSAHSLGRLRVRVSPLPETESMPIAVGRWYTAGSFQPAPGKDRKSAAYTTAFGPESASAIDPEAPISAASRWEFDAALVDSQRVALSSGLSATYLGRTIWSPDDRNVRLHLGSDDGFMLFVNGEQVAERRINRGVALDQDAVDVALKTGANTLVLKIVNTGGPGGYAFRIENSADVLSGELMSALMPTDAVPEVQRPQLTQAWRRKFFDGYRKLDDERLEVASAQREVRKSLPRTMVMRELAEPRPTHVLMRGQYDAPDPDRPVERRTPEFLAPLPKSARRDRLGFAEWLTSPDNALFARVAVNRFWQLVFGAGLVRTPGDFGLQGDWPTHPELLDWLAVDFVESGFDVHALLRQLVLSSTYRQSSHARPDLAEIDPDDRLLARYPRRRLSAEQIRDHALYTSGLLVERFGGPSVKPYQPAGLWREVAMLASNTREFEVGADEALWRRSLYTYWKRAVPPPSMQTFDAPTRESCTVERARTNTPLQALVLWNDVQFVEAARTLAERLVADSGDEGQRIARLFRIATARSPDDAETSAVTALLAASRARFASAPGDAAALLSVGEAPLGESIDPVELAAWTLVVSSILNLHETLTQD